MTLRYIEPSSVNLSDEILRALPADEQKEAMEVWFRANFEDPAERTPYETAEGGYQWIWGGPYDATEELQGRFAGIVADDVIESLVSDLQHDGFDWAPTPRREDYDDDPPDDPLPLDTPPVIRQRFNALVERHEEWLHSNAIPEGGGAEARAEVIRRLDDATTAALALASFAKLQSGAGRSRSRQLNRRWLAGAVSIRPAEGGGCRP